MKAEAIPSSKVASKCNCEEHSCCSAGNIVHYTTVLQIIKNYKWQPDQVAANSVPVITKSGRKHLSVHDVGHIHTRTVWAIVLLPILH